jgi:hypothetical protein
VFATLATGAAFDHAWIASVGLGVVAGLAAIRGAQECATATGALLQAVAATRGIDD